MQKPKAFGIFVLGVLHLMADVTPWCPQGWYNWHQSCYMPLNGSLSWREASVKCRSMRGWLSVINSEQEHKVVIRLRNEWFREFSLRHLWLGCEVFDGNIHCPAGGMNGSGVFIDWAKNSGRVDLTLDDRKCIRKGGANRGKLYVSDCNNPYFAICEMPASQAYCASLGADGRPAQLCLLGHHIKNLTVKGVGECGQACWAQPQCLSFNLWYGGPTKICQLNDVQRTDVSKDDFKEQHECIYFDV